MRKQTLLVFFCLLVVLALVSAEGGNSPLPPPPPHPPTDLPTDPVPITGPPPSSAPTPPPTPEVTQGNGTQPKCCNTCPPPKVIVNPIIKHKKVPVHVPYPVLKPFPEEKGFNETCPEGYEMVGKNKCMKRIDVGENTPCPSSFIRLDKTTCVRVIIIKIDPPFPQVQCPPGFERSSKLGCKPINSTYVEEDIGQDLDKPIDCPEGYRRKGPFHCVKVVECPKQGGWVHVKGIGCVPLKINCPPGYKRLGRNKCVKVEFKCPEGTEMNKEKTACIKKLPIKNTCPEGYKVIPGSLECVLEKCFDVQCPQKTCPKGKIAKIPKGECCPSCFVCSCPANYEPVCGDDGITYINDCHAKCLQVNVVTAGACKNPPENTCDPDIIPDKQCFRKCFHSRFAPVCTNDGTFPTACVARCMKRTIVSRGPCKPHETACPTCS